MIVNYDHFYFWRQTTFDVYVCIDVDIYRCVRHMYSCINKLSREKQEKLSVNNSDKDNEEWRESNQTNHFRGRLRNNRLIVDDDTTRHTSWHKMVPTCIVYVYIYICICISLLYMRSITNSLFPMIYLSIFLLFLPRFVYNWRSIFDRTIGKDVSSCKWNERLWLCIFSLFLLF